MIKKRQYIDFTKMQANGNDFVIIDNRDENISKEKIIQLTPQLCDRHYGIGADGLITLQPPRQKAVDYTMFYRNADGSDAGMCGNGARCLARFAQKVGLNSSLSFNVHDTVYQAKITSQNQVQLSFPMEPVVEEVAVGERTCLKIFTGTQHIVLQQSADMMNSKEQLKELGQQLRNNQFFEPTGTNVNFIHGISKNTVDLYTYEKGVEDLTLACGTGAIAAALAWHHIQENNAGDRQSTLIQTDGGTLQVGFNYYSDKQKYVDITLSGQAQFVFNGRYEL